MLETKDCCLTVVDVQGKLAQLMHGKESLFKNIQILIQAAKILEIPIVWCQQVPANLGPTVAEIEALLKDYCQPIDKSAFSCCGEPKFNERLQSLGRRQVLICGIETHVCVYQTAIDLSRKGYEVIILADAVSSRTAENRQIAIEKMRGEGIAVASTEMVLFELLKTAYHPRFRDIARLVK